MKRGGGGGENEWIDALRELLDLDHDAFFWRLVADLNAVGHLAVGSTWHKCVCVGKGRGPSPLSILAPFQL